jgi:eukaryotic-like serine/threonine-protein kinase
MGRYPITQSQYQAVMGYNPSGFQEDGANRPVEKVSWEDAIAFCEKLSQKTQRTYRLPSEAEWEYACRAGTTTPFYCGKTITTDLANCDEGATTAVGSFPPNAFGLFDIHGNVWEWCADHWHPNYQGAPTDGSSWTTGGDSNCKLLRGGFWGSLPWGCRSAIRYYNFLNIRFSGDFGFRVCCSAFRT